MTDDVDVAIVGGGAAGIAAGRHLSALGRSVLIVEALPRIGGRAHTVQLGGMPIDFGCGWLHSAERNPLVPLAEACGLAIDRSEAAWGEQLDNLHFPAAAQDEAPPAKLLPPNVYAYVAAPDVTALKERFRESAIGALLRAGRIGRPRALVERRCPRIRRPRRKRIVPYRPPNPPRTWSCWQLDPLRSSPLRAYRP